MQQRLSLGAFNKVTDKRLASMFLWICYVTTPRKDQPYKSEYGSHSMWLRQHGVVSLLIGRFLGQMLFLSLCSNAQHEFPPSLVRMNTAHKITSLFIQGSTDLPGLKVIWGDKREPAFLSACLTSGGCAHAHLLLRLLMEPPRRTLLVATGLWGYSDLGPNHQYLKVATGDWILTKNSNEVQNRFLKKHLHFL